MRGTVPGSLVCLSSVALPVPSWVRESGAYAALGWTPLLIVPAVAPALVLRPVPDVRRHLDTPCVSDRVIR